VITIDIKSVLEKPVFVNTDQSVSQVANMMSRKGLSEVFVKEKIYSGVVSSLDMITRKISDPDNVKISFYKKSLKPFSSKDSEDSLVNSVMISDYRQIPVDLNGSIKTLRKINMLKLIDKNSLKDLKVKDVMNFPVCVKSDDSISSVKSIMRDFGTSRVPVIDDSGKTSGLVESQDLLNTILSKKKEHRGERKGVKSSPGKIPVSSFAKNNFVICNKDADLKKVLNKMMNKQVYTAIVEDFDKFTGMFTLKDVFKLSGKSFKEAYIKVSGLGDDDPYVADVLENLTEKAVAKFSKVIPITYLALHIERYKKSGGRTKYSVQGRLVTERGSFFADATEWDVAKATREIIGKMDREIKRKIDKKRKYEPKY